MSGSAVMQSVEKSTAFPERRLARSIMALLPPLLALGLQLWLWPLFRPSIWFLFYPAVFFSSWIGGSRAGAIASIFSAAAAMWFFLPPGHSFAVPVGQYLAAGVFVATGVTFGAFHDRLRRANERTARSLEAIASLLEQAPDGIFIADLEGRYVDVNGAGCRMLGRTREELIGKTILDLIPDDRIDQLEREKECLLRGEDVVSEWVLRKKDGTWLPAEVSAKILSDGRWQGFVRDISDRKQLENEQRLLSEAGSILASTLDLDATLTSIGGLATRAFADFCVVYVTEKGGDVRRLKVVSRDPEREWLCKAVTELPLERENAREIWSELEANRTVHVARVAPEWILGFARNEEHRRVLRELDPKSIIMAPLFAHGKLIGAMALISTAKERAYSSTDVRFAEQIAQRAAYAIDNAQLYAAARRAIQTRDKVLAVVAHDLRNPLGAMVLHATLLRRAGDSEVQSKKSAESIERTGRRMDRIIQDLLDVTRMHEGQLSVEQTRTSARQAIADCVEAHAPLATAASLHLVIEAPEDLPEVWADRHRLLQVLENLMGNAMKFTDAGGSVSVGAAPKEGEVLFWVRDTGAGIAPEAVPQVFDRFWQANRGHRGLGLGLAIVKGLVEAHGGRIWIESQLGQGTTVFFTIPAAPTTAVKAPEPSPQGELLRVFAHQR